ncbi:hypothetical protein DFS34DRAFT_597062 [Phlyctochytrium arcticum]|nr:hypothetical protein DFS34DRAFT_597062 [Phlyctochytrium arcticum]
MDAAFKTVVESIEPGSSGFFRRYISLPSTPLSQVLSLQQNQSPRFSQPATVAKYLAALKDWHNSLNIPFEGLRKNEIARHQTSKQKRALLFSTIYDATIHNHGGRIKSAKRLAMVLSDIKTPGRLQIQTERMLSSFWRTHPSP